MSGAAPVPGFNNRVSQPVTVPSEPEAPADRPAAMFSSAQVLPRHRRVNVQMTTMGRMSRSRTNTRVSVMMIVVTGLLGRAEQQLVAQETKNRPWANRTAMEGILEATSGEDILLTRVWGITVDSEGRIYVKDDSTRGVIVLAPDLTYQRTLGRAGEGPGEFGHVSTVQVLPGDSVFVYDRKLHRVTVFSPRPGEVAYVRRLLGPPYQSVFRAPEGFIAIRSPAYEASGSDIGVEKAWLLRVRLNGSIADSLFSYPRKVNLVSRAAGGGTVGISSHPFGHTPFVQVLDGDSLRAIYASSLALRVQSTNLETGAQTEFSHSTTPIRVTSDELESIASQKSSRYARLLRDGAPYTWPAITGMVADEDGLVLLGIRRLDDRMTWEWAMFRFDGQHILSVTLPAGFVVHAVSEGRFIGSINTEADVPRIRTYRVGSDSLGAAWGTPRAIRR